MSLTKFARLTIAAAAAVLSVPGFAADTGTLTVNAEVQGVCKFATVPVMAFVIDPSTNVAATASSTVTYRCTKNSAAPTITLNSGASPYTGVLDSPTTTTDMNFQVTWTNPATGGNGFNQPAQSVTLSGTVAVAQFQDAAAANDYTASTTIEINP